MDDELDSQEADVVICGPIVEFLLGVEASTVLLAGWSDVNPPVVKKENNVLLAAWLRVTSPVFNDVLLGAWPCETYPVFKNGKGENDVLLAAWLSVTFPMFKDGKDVLLAI